MVSFTIICFIEILIFSANADQMQYSAVSDLGLHCLPLSVTLLGASRLKCVNLYHSLGKFSKYPVDATH